MPVDMPVTAESLMHRIRPSLYTIRELRGQESVTDVIGMIRERYGSGFRGTGWFQAEYMRVITGDSSPEEAARRVKDMPPEILERDREDAADDCEMSEFLVRLVMKRLPGLTDGLDPDGRRRILDALRNILSEISVLSTNLSETGKTLEEAAADLSRGWLDISELDDVCSDEYPFNRSGAEPMEFCRKMCMELLGKIREAAGPAISLFISEVPKSDYSGEPILVLSEPTRLRERNPL